MKEKQATTSVFNFFCAVILVKKEKKTHTKNAKLAIKATKKNAYLQHKRSKTARQKENKNKIFLWLINSSDFLS